MGAGSCADASADGCWHRICAEFERSSAEDEYDIDYGGPALGRGASGSVRRARRRVDGTECAIKIQTCVDRALVVARLCEGYVQRQLEHRNVIEVRDVFFKTVTHGTSWVVYIVMELCVSALQKELEVRAAQFPPDKFPERVLRQWTADLAAGLAYLHSTRVKAFPSDVQEDNAEGVLMHRDLKPENCMLVPDPLSSSRLILKLGDFGISRVALGSVRSAVGSMGFMAPEVALGLKYSTKVDLFSMGAVLCRLATFQCVMYTMVALVDGYDPARDLQPPISRRYSAELAELIYQLLDRNPANRPSADQILALPWIALITGHRAERLNTVEQITCPEEMQTFITSELDRRGSVASGGSDSFRRFGHARGFSYAYDDDDDDDDYDDDDNDKLSFERDDSEQCSAGSGEARPLGGS